MLNYCNNPAGTNPALEKGNMLTSDPNNKRALVVDDDPLFCFFVAIALKKAGYEVREASNGRQALDVLETEKKQGRDFDLFVIDLLMPVMDGIELILRMRNTNVPGRILVVSGSIDAEVSKELASFGCNNWLAKPFMVNQLMDAVQQTQGRGV
jgi:two-component system, chemotaxis family, chemotaxis protein CheY